MMKQWRVVINSQQYGPVSQEELKGWIAQSRVGPNDMVWSDGMPNWVAAGSVAELGFPPTGAPGAPPPIPPAAYQQPHRGGTILALGILGFVVCVICGIIAWVMGNDDLKKMDAGVMDPTGRGMTQAGKILGIISVIFMLVGIVVAIIINLVVATAAVHTL
jgi:hypothetical protein